MIYKWKNRSYPVNAQSAGEFLKQLENKEGCLTPAIIVEYSKKEDDVLYPCFEWQDEIAAQKYRQEQAREILRHLVVVRHKNEEEKQVRAFLNVVTKNEEEKQSSIFLSVDAVMSNAEYKNYVLQEALRELNAFKNKYNDLHELAKVFLAIDELTIQQAEQETVMSR